MKKISKMTAGEVGKVLWDLFGGDDRELLEDCGYVEDNLSDHYDRADIAAITPEAWAVAWDSYDRRKGAASMGRKGGKSRSDAKASAARENGRRGGRPVERRPYWILSGEGDVGGWRRYVTTPRGASMIATRERCDGDRWAQIWEEVPETEATRSHIRRVGYSDTRDIPTIE